MRAERISLLVEIASRYCSPGGEITTRRFEEEGKSNYILDAAVGSPINSYTYLPTTIVTIIIINL